MLGLISQGVSHASSFGELFILISRRNGNEMTRKDLRNIFLNRKRRWNSNLEIRRAKVQQCDRHPDFLGSIMMMSDRSYKKQWYRHVFTGAAKLPRVLDSQQEGLKFASIYDGAVVLYCGQPSEKIELPEGVLRIPFNNLK